MHGDHFSLPAVTGVGECVPLSKREQSTRYPGGRGAGGREWAGWCPLGWLEGAGRDGGGERGARQEQCWHAARSWSRELRREEGRGEDQGGEERESERCRKCAHGGVPTLLLLPVPEPT